MWHLHFLTNKMISLDAVKLYNTKFTHASMRSYNCNLNEKDSHIFPLMYNV
jgi:hypothetical protein